MKDKQTIISNLALKFKNQQAADLRYMQKKEEIQKFTDFIEMSKGLEIHLLTVHTQTQEGAYSQLNYVFFIFPDSI